MNKQLSDKINIDSLQRVAKNKNYKIFSNGLKDYNLNIWNVRANDPKSNTFNDIGVIFWKYNGKWMIHKYDITTDPGLFYLHQLCNPYGTAILKPGQYLNCWELGLHKGKYKALVQVKPVTTIRDFDKDSELDYNHDIDEILADPLFTKKKYNDPVNGSILEIYNPEKELIYRESTGMYGINYHHSGKTFIGKKISNWSAGCTVMDSYELYWNDFIPLLQDAAATWGNIFSITLIEEIDFNHGI